MQCHRLNSMNKDTKLSEIFCISGLPEAASTLITCAESKEAESFGFGWFMGTLAKEFEKKVLDTIRLDHFA
uniref:AlNc14C486G11904 protein n=1 Tax=Albugo laibachii Nc14 TaxID=890382 RepID=F0X0G1_9STRA|nr:AlNc14C486G11904 [Albugo laibachii Nc14]|eukprot:CCA27250.1 AlNc14C486G11904 [Albugo laibachii Nc14]